MGLGVSYGESKSSSESHTQLTQAVQQVYALFGQEDGKYSLALPKLRIPGATGGDIDWRKVTRALVGEQT
jgi:hypothetical protein